MIVELAQPKQRPTERLDASGRSARRAPGRNAPGMASAPPPSHLQAIHATKDGVVLRGMQHETFWEWHA